MGAFILAGIVATGAVAIALLSEFARGMASAPSMHQSSFFPILGVGLSISALIAATHWLPNIGW